MPGLLKKRNANKLAKETTILATSDVGVHSDNFDSKPMNDVNLDSKMLQNENDDLNFQLNDIVASNQLQNVNFDSNLTQDYNIDELCTDIKEMYQASTFSFEQVCEVFDSLHFCSKFNNHKQKKFKVIFLQLIYWEGKNTKFLVIIIKLIILWLYSQRFCFIRCNVSLLHISLSCYSYLVLKLKFFKLIVYSFYIKELDNYTKLYKKYFFCLKYGKILAFLC